MPPRSAAISNYPPSELERGGIPPMPACCSGTGRRKCPCCHGGGYTAALSDGWHVQACPLCESAGHVSCVLCTLVPSPAAIALFAQLDHALGEARLLAAASRAQVIASTLRLGGGRLNVVGVLHLMESIGVAPDRGLVLLRTPTRSLPINAAALWAPVLTQLAEESALYEGRGYPCLSGS